MLVYRREFTYLTDAGEAYENNEEMKQRARGQASQNPNASAGDKRHGAACDVNVRIPHALMPCIITSDPQKIDEIRSDVKNIKSFNPVEKGISCNVFKRFNLLCPSAFMNQHQHFFKCSSSLLCYLNVVSTALPERYRRLMSDPASPIVDFYPNDFEIDMNGKRFAWQEEEQFRNCVMFDLLYVHPRHPLAAQIAIYYRLSGIEKSPWPVDAVASAGMNGFLWLTKRNDLKRVIPSPALNVTYLNPTPHAHTPKPPSAGVNMRVQTVKSFDIKPAPTLWHEDNGGRHQLGKERPQVSRAISGPILGEAAHRLVHNTLNIKSDRTNSFNFHGNHVDHLAVPSGYGRYGYNEQGYYNDPNSFSVQYSPHTLMGSAPYGGALNNLQNNRPIYNAQDRYSYHEQHHDLRGGMSALTIEGGSSKGRSLAGYSSRSPNSFQMPHTAAQLSQQTGPLLSPLPKWISKRPDGATDMYYTQQTSVAAGQGEHSYQVKNKTGSERR
ncbi:hypothetical protein SASPL_108400 [Salvia splendens]|uniref:Xrn1 helical domain-containing protein n=1 Tax=Salvia splendens TaxID=180675 RepID=A0A8X8YC75_SALSN|nr:hypothetical protein SASPL_108400 [Salvia splendens]